MDRAGETVSEVLVAVESEPVKIVQLLKASNVDGLTPLLLAARNGHALAVREIIKYSRNIDIEVELQQDFNGDTARDLALKYDHDEIFAFLSKK